MNFMFLTEILGLRQTKVDYSKKDLNINLY